MPHLQTHSRPLGDSAWPSATLRYTIPELSAVAGVTQDDGGVDHNHIPSLRPLPRHASSSASALLLTP